jgi:cyanate lyase
MTHGEATEKILKAKKEKGLSWDQIASEVGAHKVWVTSVLLGQNSMDAESAAKVKALLDLDDEVAATLQVFPTKGSLGAAVPVDPLLYRFHEITQVYGTTFKEIIHEMFGDGIMSAIDFEVEIKRKPDPKGDRVVITFDGKFLPYRKW